MKLGCWMHQTLFMLDKRTDTGFFSTFHQNCEIGQFGGVLQFFFLFYIFGYISGNIVWILMKTTGIFMWLVCTSEYSLMWILDRVSLNHG